MNDDDFTLETKWLGGTDAFRFRLTHKSGKYWDHMVDCDELDRDSKLYDKIIANLRKHAEKEMYESAEESREKIREAEFVKLRWPNVGNSTAIKFGNYSIDYPDTYEKFAERYPTKEELEEKRRKELLERHKDDDNFGMF